MLAIYLCRKHTAATYGEISKHFGAKTHSTAVAAEKKVRVVAGEGRYRRHRRPRLAGEGTAGPHRTRIAAIVGSASSLSEFSQRRPILL